LIVLLSAVFLSAGTTAAIAALDSPATESVGTTGAQSGTQSGAQTTSTCPTPRLTGLPKARTFTNATIHFKLVKMTQDAAYLIKVGSAGGEVLSGLATGGTVKSSFQLPDQGPKSQKIVITAIVSSDACENSPWKLQKKIDYKGYKVAAPPATPPAAATPTAPGATSPTKAVPKPTVPPAITPLKLPKPLAQRVPSSGAPLSVRTWMTPIDNGSRLSQGLPQPKLARLERKADRANSSNALFGLAIVFLIFVASTIGGLFLFHRRDETQFDTALSQQLKHLEEGDPGLVHSQEEPATAPFAVQMAGAGPPLEELPVEPPTEVPAETNGVAEIDGATPEPLTHHRVAVEAELQRILNEAGLHAELNGILIDAKAEAERQGIAIDPDVMLQALCDELNGSAKLSDPARAELRAQFEQIIAEEAQQVPQQAS
jgi:hypothetical protein